MNILIDDKLKDINKTRYWLAQQTNLSYDSIKKLCDNNTTSIKFDTIENICRVLQCSVQDIMKIDD